MSKTDLVVVGCPVANRAWVLPRWMSAVESQVAGDTDWRRRSVCVFTPSDDETESTLRQHGTTILDGGSWTRPAESIQNHYWEIDHFTRMASWRNQLLDYCIENDAEWFFSVDSDIILPPNALGRLISIMQTWGIPADVGAISPLVNMAAHLDPGTFAWNYMSWVPQSPYPQAYRPPFTMSESPFLADVIMAAVLIHRSAFHVKWECQDQGEDIGYCWNALTHDIKLAIDPTLVCNHVMKPS